ncbi:MAG: outer membrane lipoprotein carrier protein LolA [Myxococcales bacterium]|nr:outer membrane lipoprotein carrier protein LolA [Myxococcales bacterium]
MTRRSFAGALAALGATLVTGPARADDVDAALERLRVARQGIRTLRGRFRQVRRIGVLATEIVSRGTLTLVHPNRLRWELESPDRVVYWVGPEGFAMTSGEGVSRVAAGAASRFAPVLGDLLALLGGELGKLRERYELAVSDTDGALGLAARPRSAELAKHLKLLRLYTGKELWRLRRLEIHEKSGDASLIDFQSFERDVEVEPELMKPPPE